MILSRHSTQRVSLLIAFIMLLAVALVTAPALLTGNATLAKNAPAVAAVVDSQVPSAEAHTNVTVAYRSGNMGSVRAQLHSGSYVNIGEGSNRTSVHRWYQAPNTCVRATYQWIPLGTVCTGSTGRWVATDSGGTWRLYDYNSR